jgi:hypothetical protein
VSSVANVASFSGLSILDCPFGFYKVYLNTHVNSRRHNCLSLYYNKIRENFKLRI